MREKGRLPRQTWAAMNGDGFCFNFSLDSEVEDGTNKGTSTNTVPSSSSCSKSKPCSEIYLQSWHDDVFRKLATVEAISQFPALGGISLEYVDSDSIPPDLETDQFSADQTSILALSHSCHSDLIPGTYEGGLKAWECAFDLVRFLAELGPDLAGKSVLDLGCGVGLPGIFSFMAGAKSVSMQDYNSEVLHYVTIPSVLANAKDSSQVKEKCHFYSGDWEGLSSVLAGRHFDIILTSETIYSPDYQPKLLSVLKKCSCPSTGMVYVAAKTVYFGVGGTAAGFAAMVTDDGTFQVEEVWRSRSSIPRVILKLSQVK